MPATSLLDALRQAPDPGGRQGCRYAWPAMLACLLLAAMNSVLRGLGINVARWLGHRYMPDARQDLASRPDRGLALLLGTMIIRKQESPGEYTFLPWKR